MAPRSAVNRSIGYVRGSLDKVGMRLICIPHAGGSSDLFWSWAKSLDRNIEVLTVRLPGHGPRIADPILEEWDALLEDTFARILCYLSEPHAFYGHCFGGRLAYELAHLARHRGAVTKRLFVSACRSPDVPHVGRYLHELPDGEFRESLRQLGASEEVLASESVTRLVMPALRNEIRLAELWNDRHGVGLDIPITAICGRDDPDDGRPRMVGWTAFGTRASEVIELPGGHSFPEQDTGAFAELINARLIM
jgi:medium-chain acyl-[acyl-carrier-protein] hydrolase